MSVMAICKWCGKEYFKNHNRVMYCSEECRKYARQDQVRINRKRYYHKYKFIMHEERKYGLGSGLLSKNRHENFEDELVAIEKEMKKLKIR